MLIFFISFQPEICHIIADSIENHKCYVFGGFDSAISAMKNLKKLPDLLVFDYTMHNHQVFNIDEFMENCNHQLPYIYYNDPCIIAENRPDHWDFIVKNSEGYDKNIPLTEYRYVFGKIADVIENPDISQYIPLMQKPKPLPEKFYITKMYREDSMKNAYHNLISFKVHSKLPENLFFLLELFYNSPDKPLSLEELQKLHLEDNRSISTKSLVIQISKLRRYMYDFPEFNYTIIKRKDGYLLLYI